MPVPLPTSTHRQSVPYGSLSEVAPSRRGDRLYPSLLRRLRHRLHGEGVEPAPPVARTAHHEDRRLVEDAVERAQQRVVTVEELRPLARHRVAGEYHGVRPVLLVAAVHHVEEQVGAGPVERAAADLVYDQAGGLHEGADHARRVPAPDRRLEPVPELARLDVVGLEAAQAALPTVGLGQVRLADPARTYERDVAPGVEVRQRGQLGQRLRVAPPYPAEVEVIEGLGLLPRQPAEPQERLYRRQPPLLREVLEGGGQGEELRFAHVVVRGERGELRPLERQAEPGRGVAGEPVRVARHVTSPPFRSRTGRTTGSRQGERLGSRLWSRAGSASPPAGRPRPTAPRTTSRAWTR